MKRDLKIEFGQYVQAKVPNTISNSMSARTEGCIALLPKDNATGSVTFLNLSSLQEVTRDQWTVLPVPDIVIQRMKDMAEKQSRKLGKDPVFQYRGGTINDLVEMPDEDLVEEPEMQLNTEDPFTAIILDEPQKEKSENATEKHSEPIENNDKIDELDEAASEYRGDETNEVGTLNNIPEMDYQVDADGDVIMDDSDSIFYQSQPKQASV